MAVPYYEINIRAVFWMRNMRNNCLNSQNEELITYRAVCRLCACRYNYTLISEFIGGAYDVEVFKIFHSPA